MNPFLFVYGTLKSSARSGYGQAERDTLHRECDVVGTATTTGRLYDLGSYPGLEGSGEGRVTGELLKLRDPGVTLLWLDRYEGIGTVPEEADEYVRVERAVRLDSGESIAAWTYVVRSVPTGCEPLQSGVWDGS